MVIWMPDLQQSEVYKGWGRPPTDSRCARSVARLPWLGTCISH